MRSWSHGMTHLSVCSIDAKCHLHGWQCFLCLVHMLRDRRALQGGAKEDDVEVPDLFRTTLVWGMFMGLSSNTRYQIVFGLERLVDSTVGRRRPLVSRYTTVGIRFVNNVIGGENFIDMARWAGVQ